MTLFIIILIAVIVVLVIGLIVSRRDLNDVTDINRRLQAENYALIEELEKVKEQNNQLTITIDGGNIDD